MPKNKGRRGEANEDWDVSGTEEGYVNNSGGNNISNRVNAEEDGEDNDNEYVNNTRGGRPRQNRGGGPSQQRLKQSLGPWTETVNESIQIMGVAQQSFKVLGEKFRSHVDDIRMIEETRASVMQLKEDCKVKDEEIRMQANTIITLSGMRQKIEEEVERQKKEIENEKNVLEQERSKQGKRVATAMAEEKLKLEELFKTQTQSFNERKKNLEDDFTKQRDENNRQVKTLQAENKRLSKTVERQEETIKAQLEKIDKVVEQCDVLERAKDSVKTEKLAREKELQMMKKEFALSPIPKENFKRRFAEIFRIIEEISFEFSTGVDGKDPETVSKELVKADPCFASVPVDDSDDSRNLCIAHAQRIISDAICEYIWQPFRSEFTLLHPDFNGLLAKISDELERSGQGGRTANVWTALTMRALQSLPADSIPCRASGSKESPLLTSSGRANAVVSKVFSVLSPLVSSSQYEDLNIGLDKLVKQAIEIWSDAQSGELKIIVIPCLEPAHREEWRSQRFDPKLPSNDLGETNSDNMSKTHSQILTLFPRVIARELTGPIRHDAGPPGSWPPDSNQEPHTIETCIHPGIGLTESSPLVVRGKEEQEEKKEFLLQALEQAKKTLHSNRRLTGQGRRESMGSSTSAPSSPSQQWNTMKSVENPQLAAALCFVLGLLISVFFYYNQYTQRYVTSQILMLWRDRGCAVGVHDCQGETRLDALWPQERT